MKNLLIVILFSSFLFANYSCKKASEEIIDCLFESAFISVNADLDSINPKLMHFKINFNGSKDVSLDNNVHWNFGDGNKITTDTIVDHAYENAGTYEAEISYTLRDANGTCSSSTNKQIVIR